MKCNLLERCIPKKMKRVSERRHSSCHPFSFRLNRADNWFLSILHIIPLTSSLRCVHYMAQLFIHQAYFLNYKNELKRTIWFPEHSSVGR